jgi:hypothetical protein
MEEFFNIFRCEAAMEAERERERERESFRVMRTQGRRENKWQRCELGFVRKKVDASFDL